MLGFQYCHCPNMELIPGSQKVKKLKGKKKLFYNYPKPI
jgi:hypothetical protein